MPKELLFSVTKKDLQVEFFSGTGAGGQYRNKHQNCVRIHHRESGAMATGQSNRDRPSNIKEALQSLVNNDKFKLFINIKAREIMDNKKIEEIIDEQMQSKNLKIEYVDDKGRWVDCINNNQEE